MLEKGKAVCPVCLGQEVGSRTYYCIREVGGDIVMEAFQNALGDVEVRLVKSTLGNIKNIRVEKVKKSQGIPKQINIAILFESSPIERRYALFDSNRICSECWENGQISYILILPPAPTYIFFIAGSPSAGKTAYLDSLEYAYSEKSRGHSGNEKVKAYEATRYDDEDGLKRHIAVKDKKSKLLANIILLDTPGEIVSQTSNHNNVEAAQIHLSRFALADGLIYVSDFRNDTINVLGKALVEAAGDEIPICAVISKCDILKSNLKKYDHPERRVFSDTYFNNKRLNKTKNELVCQAMIDEYILKTTVNPRLVDEFDASERRAFFLTSSGIPVAGKENQLDIGKSFGVLEPFEHLLYQLDII